MKVLFWSLGCHEQTPIQRGLSLFLIKRRFFAEMVMNRVFCAFVFFHQATDAKRSNCLLKDLNVRISVEARACFVRESHRQFVKRVVKRSTAYLRRV